MCYSSAPHTDGEAGRAVTLPAPASPVPVKEILVKCVNDASPTGGRQPLRHRPAVADLRDAYADVLLRDEACVHGVSFMRRCMDCDEAES